MEEHDVLLPLSFDIQATLIMLAYPSLVIAALISIFRVPHDRAGSKFWWSALVIVLPLIGAAAWFLFGAPPLRRRAKLQ
ncbi:PLDc N-terminal domain-containing protein [Rhodococcus sp. ACT016]|uniref:PLDc N-terminal domain-containing protein n=1 Tax=Rhodococcus sp. ACT016 TaxID=3134808 RepID=UPI003D29B845